jgi:long-chain acyl-CoA synthetase
VNKNEPRLSPFQHDWVFAHAARNPGAPAVATPTIRVTYGELAERVRILALQLHETGVRFGDRVLIALPNLPASVIAGLAIQMLGATSVEAGRELGDQVVDRILSELAVRHLVIAAPELRKWHPLLEGRDLEGIWVVQHGDGADLPDTIGGTPVRRLAANGNLAGPHAAGSIGPAEKLDRSSAAVILYTSGSTGQPHGVVQTHGNIDANTRSIVEYLHLSSADRALLTLPLRYCYGRSVLQTHLYVGGSVYMDDRFAFPAVVLEAIARERCTGFAGVPLTFEILRRQVDVEAMAFPSLRYLTQAGGPMRASTAAWVRRAFSPAELYVMYGQTEATARLSYLPPDRAADKVESIGVPIPGVDLRVVDEAGTELPPGEVGELVARGENVTPGYVNDPEGTATILHDGWLWTGDLASRDADGFLYLKGRVKEILKVGGHRVSPAEIEEVIALHPAVVDAAVTGTLDTLLGEVPTALFVAREDHVVDIAELRSLCRERLPAHAVPVSFTQVEALPRGETGKLRRSELADLLADAQDRAATSESARPRRPG